MKLELEFGEAYCYTPTFVINGIEAHYEDFGEKYDADQENAEEHGCGNMTFSRAPARQEVLSKYGITEPEYELIAGQLEVGLSFGACRECD